MKITEVTSRNDRKEFIDFPKQLYKDDSNWICPLDSGIESTFDPSKNHAFRNGTAIRWVLRDDNGKTIGRVAAFTDNIRSAANSQPTGGMGFFEVINDKEAAFRLFDTAKEWLSSKGIEAMDGPVNFGENDNNWGLLVDGFMQQGYGMPYNMKYYKDFFEVYGFRNYFEQYSYHVGVDKFPDRIMKIAEWISKRPGYSFRHFQMKNSRKYVDDIVEIYNSAWSAFKEDFTPLDPAILEESLKKAEFIIDEEIIWFGYFNDKPIAFFILFPDVNQILRHLDGKLHPLNMLKILYYKMTHKMTRMRGVVGGVHPNFQNSGVESAIFLQLYHVFVRKTWYKELELSWVGDFNPKMMAIYEAIGSKRAKTHITYRYLINKKLPFMRYKDEMAAKKTE
jgi:hypothetical protein